MPSLTISMTCLAPSDTPKSSKPSSSESGEPAVAEVRRRGGLLLLLGQRELEGPAAALLEDEVPTLEELDPAAADVDCLADAVEELARGSLVPWTARRRASLLFDGCWSEDASKRRDEEAEVDAEVAALFEEADGRVSLPTGRVRLLRGGDSDVRSIVYDMLDRDKGVLRA